MANEKKAQLYADAAYTIPVSPKTKIRTISNDNNVGLQTILDQLGEKIDGIPQSDWNQNDSMQLDHIKNRTHWVSEGTNVVIPATTQKNITKDKSGWTSDVYEPEYDYNKEYLITVDGVQYRCTPYTTNDGYGSTFFSLGDSRLFEKLNDNDELVPDNSHPENVPFLVQAWVEDADGTGYTYRHYWSFSYSTAGTQTIEIAELTGEMAYHPLDERFIPDTIAIQTYTHSSGTLTGTGANGKVKATATATYSSFTIGGTAYAVKAGDDTSIDFVSGVWYMFVLDTTAKTINFKSGGGVSKTKLAKATATEADVAAGKTFYAGSTKNLRTGTADTKYQNGRRYLYKAGMYYEKFNTNTHITSSSYYQASIGRIHNTMSVLNFQLYDRRTNVNLVFEKIDLTNYTKLVFVVTSAEAKHLQLFGVATSMMGYDTKVAYGAINDGTASTGETIEVDLSSVSGEHYPFCGIMGNNSGVYASSMNISEIYLV